MRSTHSKWTMPCFGRSGRVQEDTSRRVLMTLSENMDIFHFEDDDIGTLFLPPSSQS